MNATPLLGTLLDALAAEKLEAVLIGNAAAAVQGAPVTTLDFDFMFRDTPVNMAKLKRLARRLDAVILRPFYPVSRLYRLTCDATGLQADFMPVIHGVRSYESLRSRAVVIDLDGRRLLAASLDDIVKSKRAADGIAIWPSCRSSSGRRRSGGIGPRMPKDPATREARVDARKRKAADAANRRGSHGAARDARARAALAAESDRQLDALIHRRLALPVEARMNFLRRRLPGGGSSL